MRNKKGFTLIELLAVIVILTIITIMASASILSFSKKSKENLYCAKIKLIESSAVDYAQRLEKELNLSTTLYENYPSLKIQVKDLLESGKLEEDKNGEVISPLDEASMNEVEIIIYLKNDRIYAKIPNNIC